MIRPPMLRHIAKSSSARLTHSVVVHKGGAEHVPDPMTLVSDMTMLACMARNGKVKMDEVRAEEVGLSSERLQRLDDAMRRFVDEEPSRAPWPWWLGKAK